jgi:N6-adenosine-specific RNA methylase IME4
MQPKKKMLPSVIQCPRMEHSRKPDLSEAIEQLYPNVKKIELFARQKRPGWDTWGNEVESDIQHFTL